MCIRVFIYIYIYIHICVCVQILDSLHDICMWPLDSFDGIHTLKGAVPLLAWQAKSDGGNGFIGASGFFGWDFYTRDDSTGLTRFHRLPNACSLFATPTLVFCCCGFHALCQIKCIKIKKYQNDPGISSNLCMCFISAVFCSLIKCCMP